jgi:hypothetical protein
MRLSAQAALARPSGRWPVWGHLAAGHTRPNDWGSSMPRPPEKLAALTCGRRFGRVCDQTAPKIHLEWNIIWSVSELGVRVLST